MPEQVRSLRARFLLFFRTLSKPCWCAYCDHPHIVWNGCGMRTVSVEVDGQIHHLTDIPIRRVRCQTCKRSWRIRPPGLLPHRHYQLCVVARGAVAVLFDDQTLEAAAQRCCCSRWTVARWIRWLDALTTPAHLLARLVERIGPVLPTLLPAVAVSRRGATAAARDGAAAVVSLLEVLGQALSQEPPGLRSVVEWVVDNRAHHTTYASPEIPEFAQSRFGGRRSM